MSDAPQGPGWWLASDGKYYPPQPPTAPPPPPPPGVGTTPGYAVPSYAPPRPAKSRNGCLIAALVVLGILVLGTIGCVAVVGNAADDLEDDIRQEDEREAEDVHLASCGRDASTGFLQATLDVRNRSSERSNYSIEVTFESADGAQVDTAVAFVSALEPGQSTQTVASTFTESAVDVECRVVDVERFSDES